MDSKIELAAKSRLYRTSPVDFLEQPEFLNNVVEIQTDLDPDSLHSRTRGVETALMDSPKIPKGPRVIDIDILTYHNERISTAALQIPHPAMCKRKFVLIPLLEIRPDEHCLLDNRSYRECLDLIDDSTQIVEIYHG